MLDILSHWSPQEWLMCSDAPSGFSPGRREKSEGVQVGPRGKEEEHTAFSDLQMDNSLFPYLGKVWLGVNMSLLPGC